MKALANTVITQVNITHQGPSCIILRSIPMPFVVGGNACKRLSFGRTARTLGSLVFPSNEGTGVFGLLPLTRIQRELGWAPSTGGLAK